MIGTIGKADALSYHNFPAAAQGSIDAKFFIDFAVCGIPSVASFIPTSLQYWVR
jgi:hypothetical protein